MSTTPAELIAHAEALTRLAAATDALAAAKAQYQAGQLSRADFHAAKLELVAARQAAIEFRVEAGVQVRPGSATLGRQAGPADPTIGV